MTKNQRMSLADLPWQNEFASALPADLQMGGGPRQVRAACYSFCAPTPVRQPQLVGWAEPLARNLGIARPTPGSLDLDLLAGNAVLPSMRPYAARYGGHQFGHWAGQLGDGRALTLGEVAFAETGALEFQLKGAGLTPYSRTADGRAVLRSSLREFLCSEAMHALGVPTTRALSLVTTGESVVRDMFYDGNPAPEPGAVVCRVAPSFLRFGNFQILAAAGEHEILAQLTDFLIKQHYPELTPGDPAAYGALLDEVCRRTAVMVAHWLRVGFVHGVMNTDNMSVLGLTIDYGPYGWLEPFDPAWTPNTTDAGRGRYRFGGQVEIAWWNLARFAEALFPLIKDEARLHTSLGCFQTTFETTYHGMLAQKLGLSALRDSGDHDLVEDLFALLQATSADYTLFFRSLATLPLSVWQGEAGLEAYRQSLTPTFYATPVLCDEHAPAWLAWLKRYAERGADESYPEDERVRRMNQANPKYVARNYLAQNAIVALEQGDSAPLERLQRVLARPYDEQPAEEDLAARRPEWAATAPGCSALSCSS